MATCLPARCGTRLHARCATAVGPAPLLRRSGRFHGNHPRVDAPQAAASDAPQPPPASGSTAAEAAEQAPGSSAAAAAPPPASSIEELFSAQELVEELKDSSTWAASGLVWFLLQGALIVLLILPPFELKGLVDLVGTLLVTAGLVFIAYGLFCLGRNLSPLPAPRRKHSLVTTGLYGYVRHPMYGGLIMAGLGLCIISRNECRLALTALLWLVLEQKAKFEESALEGRYPETYKAYAAKVAKFFPYLY